MVIVTKFGGTSAKDGPTLEHVINNIILANPQRRVVVFSAPGKRDQSDIKVTDLLIKIGESYYGSGEYPTEFVDKLKSRFTGITDYFGIEHSFLDSQFSLLEAAIRATDSNKDAYLDGIKPFGEIINAEIVAEVLGRRGINATIYRPENIGMVTDGNFSNSRLKDTSYKTIAEALKPVLESDGIIIIPGFYGVDEQGRYATFPRGGSDLTGAILANALDATLYENWTDTDGIRRADPKIVQEAGIIERLTYREARELAYSGAEILHPDTLIPLIAKNIPLHVRNTFKPDREGTYIGTTKGENEHIVEGIAHKEGFTIVYIEKTGMNEEIGYVYRLTEIFSNHRVSIDQMTTSIDSVSVAVAANGNNGRIESVVHDIIRNGLVNPNGVSVEPGKAMVCIVGEGMKHTPGVLKRLSDALASNDINIETVYQGPSERSVIFGLAQEDAKRAVRAIYDAYFGRSKVLVAHL